MREIKFRGKRKDTGEWVYGWLSEDIGAGLMISPKIFFSTYIIEEDDEGNDMYDLKADGRAIGGFFSVTPETVGQFTGLKDKNGKEVCECDIVTCTAGCPHVVEFFTDNGGMFFGGMPGFNLAGLQRNGGQGYAWAGTEEIIGNIHDNPELT